MSVADDVAAGVVIALVAILASTMGSDLLRLPWTLAAAAAGHLGKLVVHAALLGSGSRFSLPVVAALHLAFGLGAGLIAWAALRAVRGEARADDR
jgi:hypothetical protein